MLNIVDEYSRLTDVAVCVADHVPDPATYDGDHPEFSKYVPARWDRRLLVAQHRRFIGTLETLGVRVHRVPASRKTPWQMYTRDVAFVVGATMFFGRSRGLPDRMGEIDLAIDALEPDDVVEITAGPVEGGDVVVHDGGAFVGLGSRTSAAAAEQLGDHVAVETLHLGPDVMHLDTRMTVVSARHALVHAPSFTDRDLRRLRERFELIEVTDAECGALATNVLMVDPETVVLDRDQQRIAGRLREFGFRLLELDYSEPIAVSGSFRCATLPLARSVAGSRPDPTS